MRQAPLRAVLDTTVLVSALLFKQGKLSWLRPCWQQGQLTPVLAESTARELLRVLAYPKFRLQPADRERLLEDLLPGVKAGAPPSRAAPTACATPTIRCFWIWPWQQEPWCW